MPDKNVAMVEKLGSGKYKIFAQDDRNAIDGNNYLLAMVCNAGGLCTAGHVMYCA